MVILIKLLAMVLRCRASKDYSFLEKNMFVLLRPGAFFSNAETSSSPPAVPVPSPAGEVMRFTSSGLFKGFPMQQSCQDLN
jgi:hypothetical protein